MRSELIEHGLLYVVGLLMGFVIGVVVCTLAGCYSAREAEPCEDYRAEGSNAAGASAPVGKSAAPQSPTIYPGPCPFKYDAVHCWCESPTHEVCDGRYCEGPYVGCIAPGSSVSSTWEGRP